MLLGVWTVFGYISPAFTGLVKVARRSWGTGKIFRGGFGLGALVIGLVLLLFVMPAPLGVVAQGVVAMPDDDEMRPGQAGTVAALLAHDGERVRVGQPIVALEDRAVQWRAVRLRARVAEVQAQLDQAQAEDQAKAGIVREQLAQARRQADDAARDVDFLRVRSPASGVLVLGNEADLPGRFAQRGETLATIWDPLRAVVRVVVPLHDALMFRRQVRGVTIRPSWDVMRMTGARILRIVPQASDILPSASLSLDGGGPFAGGRDQDHQFHTHEALFEVDVRAESAWPVPFLNGRMYVRFALPPEPAGVQIFRAVRLVFLRWLND
jgi:putative peptide zinc metalloprotease protein